MKTLPQKGTFLKCVTYMTTPSVLTPSVVHLFICSFFRSTQSEKKNALSLLSNIRGYVNFFYYFPKPQVDFHLLIVLVLNADSSVKPEKVAFWIIFFSYVTIVGLEFFHEKVGVVEMGGGVLKKKKKEYHLSS